MYLSLFWAKYAHVVLYVSLPTIRLQGVKKVDFDCAVMLQGRVFAITSMSASENIEHGENDSRIPLAQSFQHIT